MKKEGWARPDVGTPVCEPEREPRQRLREPSEFEAEPKRMMTEEVANSLSKASLQYLTGEGREIILELMAELRFLNRNHQTLADMVEDYLNGEKDGRERAKLIKALDHDTRAKSASALATALQKLQDAAPGKKEQAQAAAETAGQGSIWGDDLDLGVSNRPSRAH